MTGKWSLPLPIRLYRTALGSMGGGGIKDGGKTGPITSPAHRALRDPWRGRIRPARRLISGETVCDPDSAYYLRFHWLRDLREFGGGEARVASRRMVAEWVAANGRWNHAAWHPEIMAARLKVMVFLWGWYGETATAELRQKILRNIARQLHFLERDLSRLADGTGRAAALTAVMLGRLFFDPAADITAPAHAFAREVTGLVLGDGCHISRRPDRHFALLRSAIEARTALGAAATAGGGETGDAESVIGKIRAQLEDTIIAMAATARMWEHGDGTFFKIKGTAALDPDAARQCLALVGQRGRITRHAGEGGFVRLKSGRSVLLMDGAPPAPIAAVAEHDPGALAIEFSAGRQRIIINAGAVDSQSGHENPGGDSGSRRAHISYGLHGPEHDPAFAGALASTAAHSTLTLDDTNAAGIGADSSRPAIGSIIETGAVQGGMAALASHDGYETTHAIRHTRRVFLATGGYELRGEDTLTYTGDAAAHSAEAVVRFHLHPQIQAILGLGGDVSLAFPGSAAGWVFRARGGAIAITPGMVLEDGVPMRTHVITVTADTSSIRETGECILRWRLKRREG